VSLEANQSNEAVFNFLRDTLVELFEIEAEAIQPEARLYEDLDIDSIDAVDMVVELKRFTGQRINPDDFKAVRTVDDVVQAVVRLTQR